MWAKAVLAQRPPDRIEHLQPPASDPDGEIARRLTSPRLMEIVFSGGQIYVEPGGLYYFGGAKAWRDADPGHRDIGPKIAILGAYGSFLCEMEWNNSFLMSTITTSHTVASFYDFQGVFPFGRMFEGATLGDCGRAAAPRGFYVSNVFGDPTVTLVDGAPAAETAK
jgi:hypothetical protein